MAAPEPAPELEALLALWRAHDSAFERAEPAWWGAVVSDRRYPAIHEANYARVEARAPIRLAEIVAGLGADADTRSHVVVFHPEEQTGLLAEAGTRGARLVWDVVMVRRAGSIDRPRAEPEVPTEEVRRFDDGFWRAHAESVRLFDVEDPDTLDQLQALERETLIPHGRRWFVVRGDGGGPVAFAALLVIGDAAFLDHVVTFPGARRRGYAEALTRRALSEAAAAGAASTFLLAEPDRPAERMYRRIGFEPVAHLSSWTLGPRAPIPDR
jgi:ribosomal protein S18 acetylase RimI-like enzyme